MDLPNGDYSTVQTYQLPAGSYTLSASLNVYNPDHDAYWGCDLNGTGVTSGDQGQTETDDSSPQVGNIALIGTATFTGAGGTVTLKCEFFEPSSTVDDIAFLATRVTTLH